MPRKIAVVEEFTVGKDEVRHVPTNAIFYAHAGREDIYQCTVGHLGSVLANGDDYEEESVEVIAARLMKDRLRISKWQCPLCDQVVTLIKGGHPRLPSDYFQKCRLPEHSCGVECIAFRQETRARELLAEKEGLKVV